MGGKKLWVVIGNKLYVDTIQKRVRHCFWVFIDLRQFQQYIETWAGFQFVHNENVKYFNCGID